MTLEDAPDCLAVDAVKRSFKVNKYENSLSIVFVSLFYYLSDCKYLIATSALLFEASLVVSSNCIIGWFEPVFEDRL